MPPASDVTDRLTEVFRTTFGDETLALDPAMTADLGVDKVFGRGTTPGEVASYLVSALVPVTPPTSPQEPA